MKPWTTSCCRRKPAGLLLLVLAVALCSACVSSGSYQEVVGERDQLRDAKLALEKRVKLLEASNESLSGERVKLIGEVEDLRGEQGALHRSVADLQQRQADLAKKLDASRRELAQREAEVHSLSDTYKGLVGDLQAEVADGQVEIEQLREGLQVKLSQAVLFPAGSAELSPAGRGVLAKVAARLASQDYAIEVQGHTDDAPIRGKLARQYPTNWELAGARAARVVRLMVEQGIQPQRLRAVSYADTRPVAPNDSAEDRARNRRIEIRLLPGASPPSAAPSPAGAPPPAASQEG